MVLSRASGLSGAFQRTVLRRAGVQTRARISRQIGRRTYASGHGEKQSSELPWIIGSVVFTVPAAGWLWQSGGAKGGHGDHGHHEEHEEKEEGGEEESGKEEEPAEEESKEDKEEPKEESKEESKDEGEEKKDDSDEAPAEESEADDSEKPSAGSPGQINYNSSMDKGPGEGGKPGSRQKSESKGQKDSASNESGAKHPYLDDPEKSKKGQGTTETAKIHGTVDNRQGARGAGQTGESSE